MDICRSSCQNLVKNMISTLKFPKSKNVLMISSFNSLFNSLFNSVLVFYSRPYPRLARGSLRPSSRQLDHARHCEGEDGVDEHRQEHRDNDRVRHRPFGSTSSSQREAVFSASLKWKISESGLHKHCIDSH